MEMLTQRRQRTASSVKSISSMASTMEDQYFWKVGITQLHIRDDKPQMPLFKKSIYLLYCREVLQATTRPPVHNRSCIQGHQAKKWLIYTQGPRQIFLFGFNCAKQRDFCPTATAGCSLTRLRQSSFNSLHVQSLLIPLTSSAKN